MATYLPSTFLWSPPTVETRLTEEPDLNEIQIRILYDRVEGRLGSDIRMKLEGSDDDTRSTSRVRTEVLVSLAQPIPNGSIGLILVAKFRCEESGFEIDHYDESGDSNLLVDYRSRPYARLVGSGALSQPSYVYDTSFFEAFSWHADKSLLIGGADEDETTEGPVAPSKVVTFNCKLTDVPPKRGLRVTVGMEDEIAAESDDTTYIVRLRSHWFLTSVELTPF